MSAVTGGPVPALLRIEKGDPDPAELAAVTTALLTRLTAVAPRAEGQDRPRAAWRRPERSPGFRGPRTWQDHRTPQDHSS
ncbi:acyl-CoA carboxylase subunit epsilon [Streptomyces sp. P9(2023)]|uniref:acyl-CoA carboxylase subunit epsilon n=1 Tax=Streptomyces sp. P9(2023) TaxID=3064394 RepID=UPI0028F45812|nr:acyl-CoA carboxylase subunit epsilon [Streptomyces sp. P9(2023)]MDT9687564.1 acyl-CoA carboxylase subunit epsilon [Streptomyces sp. P9(2023)]